MTHDELLVKIKTGNEFAGIKYAPDAHTFALRAVVELHKPMLWKNLGNDTDGYQCEVCGNGSYPCTTIQVLEKELE